MRAAALAASLGLAGAGCLPLGPPAERVPFLTDLATNVVVATYADFDSSSRRMADALVELEASPNEETLAAAQAAWRAARKPWKQSQAFGFGPVEDLDLAGPIDWWPAKQETIEAEIARDAPITADSIEALGSSAKGFMALEYLLFDPEGGDAAVLAAFSGEGAAARRRAYASGLGENLAAKAKALHAAWDPAQGNYAEEVSQAGRGSEAFPTVKLATDTFVNEMVFLTEKVADTQIGKPLGKSSGGVVAPELEESARSDNSTEDMLDHLRGVEHVYHGRYGGADGLGVSDLIATRDRALDERVGAAIEKAMASVEAIPEPFRTALTDDPTSVGRAWDDVKALKRLLGSEVVTALGTTAKFNDNDGD